MSTEPSLFIGMLSGTSRDGVDLVLVRFSENRPELVSSLCVAYTEKLATALGRMVDRRRRPAEDDLIDVDHDLAEFFALSAWALLDRAGVKVEDVTAIGSHGQTVWHDPFAKRPESIQLGNPQLIANLTGLKTVACFRQADIDAGGQGAPLAPLLHAALLKPATGTRAVLNIGGIANVSLLSHSGTVEGFDTGPGNCLMDAWIRKHKDVEYDDKGAWAAGGAVDYQCLQSLFSDPYFSMPAPKSTGVEYFNFYWLQGRLDQLVRDVSAERSRNVQATLCELTAHSIAEAIRSEPVDEVLVCGGGVHNVNLLHRLARLIPDARILTTASQGLEPDWMEGILFAWLARERLNGHYLDTTPITGAKNAVMLGEVFEPGRGSVDWRSWSPLV